MSVASLTAPFVGRVTFNVLARHIDFSHLRVVQRELARIDARLVPGSSGLPNDEAGATQILRSILHLDIAIDFVPVCKKPTHGQRKSRNFVNSSMAVE